MFEWLAFGFMQRALAAGVMIALTMPLLGVFLVLRRQSLMADTLSHVALAGVALGLLLGAYPLLFSLLFAILGALAVERLRYVYSGYAEVSLAILMSAGLSLAVVWIGLGSGYNLDVFSYLFGSIVAVQTVDLWSIFSVCLAVALFILWQFRALFSMVFDEENARLKGIPVQRLNFFFTLLTALLISVSIRVIGVLLVSALLVLPVAAAMQLAGRFRDTLWLAVGFSLCAVFSGLYLSYHVDLAPGGTVVLLLVLLLVGILAGRRLLAGRGV